MLKYRKGFFGCFLLPHITGTAWPHGILPGLLSAIVGLVLGLLSDLDDTISSEGEFVDDTYPYQLFAYLVAFVLIFRTNFGYMRYWEAIDGLQKMGAKWVDGAMMSIAFDAKGDCTLPFLQCSMVKGTSADPQQPPLNRPFAKDGSEAEGPDHESFFVEVVHLFSLLHALALQHLRCDADLHNLESCDEVSSPKLTVANQHTPSHTGARSCLRGCYFMGGGVDVKSQKLQVLGGLMPEELSALSTDSQGRPIPTAVRVAMVESWVLRRVTARQKHEPAGDMCKTAPPILSRMVQVISNGNLAFSEAAKASDVQFPFPYHNLISLFLWVFMATSPFVINAKVLYKPARFVLNAITVWAYFSLAEVGDNLEDPYTPYDPNDLPLESIQHSFNVRLLAVGRVPEPRTSNDQISNEGVENTAAPPGAPQPQTALLEPEKMPEGLLTL